MTIDKVPDCIGVMKFERVKEGEEKETKEVDLQDWVFNGNVRNLRTQAFYVMEISHPHLMIFKYKTVNFFMN